MQLLGTIPLDTPRLRLRRFTPGDAPAMFKNWATDPEVARHILWEPNKTLEDTQRAIAPWVKSYRNPLFLRWCIVWKESGEPIGTIALVRVEPEHEAAEAVYQLGRAYWGGGIMTEALDAVLQFGFEGMELNRIYAGHFTKNPASGRVMEKVGMRLEGVMRQRYRGKEGLEDTALYAILREEYGH